MVLQALLREGTYLSPAGSISFQRLPVSCCISPPQACTYKNNQAGHQGHTSPMGLQGAWQVTLRPLRLQASLLKHAEERVMCLRLSYAWWSRALQVVSLHLHGISLWDSLSLLEGEGGNWREARHQGKDTAQHVLADFAHSQFAAPEEGSGCWREQRQTGFRRSPGSGWAEIRIHNQHGQQMWV